MLFGVCSGGFLGLLAEPDSCLGMGECRPYVENYTVDASIFEHCRGIHLPSVVFENNVLTPWPSGRGTKPLVMSRRRMPLYGADGAGTRFILMYVVSSFKEQTVDALATGAEEGRSNLR